MKSGRAALLLCALLSWELCAQTPVKPKVACVGDSITAGTGLPDPSTQSYPAKLGRLLATTHTVQNFGVSGTTLLTKGDMPYVLQSQYTASKTFKPDIVIIMLGSNDAKPQNWRYGTNFTSDYLALIASYTALTSKPSIYLCTPCPGYGSGAYDIRPGTVQTNIVPAVRELSQQTGLPLIDVNTFMNGHPEWFPDLIHPSTAGTSALATGIYATLIGATNNHSQPTLALRFAANGRAYTSWPASNASFFLQEAKVLLPTNTAWSVVDVPAYNDGNSVTVSNLLPGVVRFYRLRKPDF